MFDIGFTEMGLVALIALLVLGPERLPVVAKKLGGYLNQSRRMFNQFTQELSKEADNLDKGIKEQVSDFEKTVKDTEKNMHKLFSLEDKKDSTSEMQKNSPSDSSSEE